MNRYVQKEGLDNLEGSIDTCIPGVHFYRRSEGSARQPLLYQSGIIMMGQGSKVIYLGEHCLEYGPGSALVLGVPLPIECEAFSSEGKPLLGIAVDVSPQTLHMLVNRLLSDTGFRFESGKDQQLGLNAHKMDSGMLGTCKRLLEALLNDVEARVLGEQIVSELVYRILIGPQGHILYGLSQHDGAYARVARALSRIHSDFDRAIHVDDLAVQANMSVSAFHRAFKDVTAESPIQYLKKVRLAKARDLLSAGSAKAAQVAGMVGYTSPSQFSREFRRHFDCSPSEMYLR